MPAALLDANVLIAMVHAIHVHHATAQRWMGTQRNRRWASCAVTQLAFIRLGALPQIGGPDASPSRALDLLQVIVADPRHDYWSEAPSPLDLRSLRSVALVGHRQVTDAWLLGLAVERGASVATLDRGLHSFALAEGLGKHVEWIAPASAAHEPAAAYAPRRVTRRRDR